MRVLVCGGRDYTNKRKVWHWIGNMAPGVVITGCANGADALAREYARTMNVPLEVFYADWDKHGRAAGPMRNERMLEKGRPNMVLAFPGGMGTRDMVQRAMAAGIPVMEVP
jgi:hypothetical protein